MLEWDDRESTISRTDVVVVGLHLGDARAREGVMCVFFSAMMAVTMADGERIEDPFAR